MTESLIRRPRFNSLSLRLKNFCLDQFIEGVVYIRLRHAAKRLVERQIEQLVEHELLCELRVMGGEG